MNEDKMIALLSGLDDDLIDREIDSVMNGVECDMESIHKKARQKLDKHNRKAGLRRRLSYAAAVGACFICLNVVYADEISKTIMSFFDKTPVYSTMVDGRAYYLAQSRVLDDSLTIDSFLVSGGRLDMTFTSKLGIETLQEMKIVPKDDADTQYVMGGYSEEGNNQYSFSFMNGKEQNYNIKPFKDFTMIVGGKSYEVTLDQARSFNGTERLAESDATANKIEWVNVGANSLELEGKRGVQLIAAFKDKNMQLVRFGAPVSSAFTMTTENKSKDVIMGSSGGNRTAPVYAVDKKGGKYQLEVPSDVKARPVTTFVTNAPGDADLTVKLPALLASYQKEVTSFSLSIPKSGEQELNREIDLVGQKVVMKSVQRLSPTSARIMFQLNTSGEKNVKVASFDLYSKDVRKITSEFSGDTAVITLDFDQNVDEALVQISWPEFVVNGNWSIHLK